MPPVLSIRVDQTIIQITKFSKKKHKMISVSRKKERNVALLKEEIKVQLIFFYLEALQTLQTCAQKKN